ncbi:hypothetical protein [Streptomyces sp. NPDC058279]|uniref:hypothetical protein n=1 Tax=Streptomyces sp. NPDC058279 TaxID=3346418 RepID=UPI0036E51DD8
MRNTLVRRTVLTASAVSLALLGTACGSDKADSKAEGKPSVPAPSAPSAAKGKTDAELAAVVVTQADLKDYLVSPEAATKAAATPVATDKAACEPLARIQAAQKVGAPVGVARTALKAKPKESAANASPEDKLKAGLLALGADQTLISIGSYDGKGAEEAFASVKAAGAACAAGYTLTAEGDKTKLDSVTPGPISARDEAVHYTVIMDLGDGEKSPGHLVAVRKGNTLATFYTFGVEATYPGDLVDTQLTKIG